MVSSTFTAYTAQPSGRSTAPTSQPIQCVASVWQAPDFPQKRQPGPWSRSSGSRTARLAPVGENETAVLWDARQEMQTERNAERARQRLPPCSTFEILNSLIAIDGGVLDPAASIQRWDPAKAPRQDFWPDEWAQDQDLGSALRRSVVWYFQEVARRTGAARLQSELRRLSYGNADISGGIDRFWLGSSLRISAEEQVRFLRALLEGKTGFSEKSRRAVSEPLVLDQGPGWRLWGKTGACHADPAHWVGWLVGAVERTDGWAVYAVNVEDATYAPLAARRMALARALLEANGLFAAPRP